MCGASDYWLLLLATCKEPKPQSVQRPSPCRHHTPVIGVVADVQAMGSTGVALQQLGYEGQGQHSAPQQGHVEDDLPYIQDEAGAAVMMSG